jgi:hypothetical protein
VGKICSNLQLVPYFQSVGISVVSECGRDVQWGSNVLSYVKVVVCMDCLGGQGELGKTIDAVVHFILLAVQTRL